jgi:hypothetical protein
MISAPEQEGARSDIHQVKIDRDGRRKLALLESAMRATCDSCTTGNPQMRAMRKLAELVVTAASFSFCWRAMAEAFTRHSLRPLLFRRDTSDASPGNSGREDADACSLSSLKKSEIAGSLLRGATRRSNPYFYCGAISGLLRFARNHGGIQLVV